MTIHPEANLHLALLCLDGLKSFCKISTRPSLALNFRCPHTARADVTRFHRFSTICSLERTVSVIDRDKVAYKTRIW